MLLTANHLATLVELGGHAPATPSPDAESSPAAATYRTLEREGLARRAHGQGYALTSAGSEARRLVIGMLAGGWLLPPELVSPEWHFLDDQILAAGRAAAREDDRVPRSAASLLLARGLAELRDEPDELRLFVALTAYGKKWLELVGRLQEQAISTLEQEVRWDMMGGRAGTEAHPVAAPA
jgi:hypothetical protein